MLAGASYASPSKGAGLQLTQICLDPPSNDQIQQGNTCGGGAFLGSQPRHCIFHKCIARFVRESWAFLSKYRVRVLIIILNARKERRKIITFWATVALHRPITLSITATVGFCKRFIFPEIIPGLGRVPPGFPKKNLCEMLVQDFIQARCPSHHSKSSFKALKEENRQRIIN